MISHFFINRPIFAAVLSIVITLTGLIAGWFLPIAQYPRVVPPGVVVAISYPGANAQVVADTVAAPIEQQVNGVPGMLYMSSQSGNDGTYSLQVTFDIGTNLNTALVMVQNRVALAMQQLPSSVQNQGITIRKKTPDILMIVSFYSDGRYDDVYLSNFATIYVRDELLRVDGVSDITYQGQRDYSIRAWLDPQALASRSMTPIDVANALRNQNLDAPAGQVGQAPAPSSQGFQLPLDTLGRLTEPEQFGDIIVKVGGDTGVTPHTRVVASSQGGTTNSGPTPAPSPSSSGTTDPGTTAGAMTAATNPDGTTTDPTSTTTTDAAATITPLTGGGSTGGGGGTGGGGNSGGGGSTGGGGGTGGAATGGAITGPIANGLPAAKSMSIVRLRDVAKIELGAQNYNQACTFDGKPSVGLSVYQLPTTNALDVADRVQKKMKELESRFPDGVKYQIAYDTTPFVRESVMDVGKTLFEAVVLVGIVVLIFLQNWRAVLIPLVAVPVAIIGTFAVMAALTAVGAAMNWSTFMFSLNNISLFGLVLAIGIVVDDAIVVVENVERWLEHGLEAHEATRKAMDEVTGPIIAVALVLCAVFVPCALISGITGQFYRQFAVTIAVSTIFSTINSLTLSPALAAILLRPRGAKRDRVTLLLDLSLGWFFWLFNKVFGSGTTAYGWVVGKFLRLNLVVVLAYGGLLALTYYIFVTSPVGFIPQQDQGRLIVNVQLPDSSSLARTKEIASEVEKIARGVPGVGHTVTMSGNSFLLGATSSNFASMFIVLKPFDERQDPKLHATEIMRELRKRWKESAKIKDAVVLVLPASPIPGLGSAGGYTLIVEDRGGLGLQSLQTQNDALVKRIQAEPGLQNASTQFRSKTPQLYFDIDRVKVATHGVSLDDVNQTLDMYLGSLYVNSFNEFGRHWQVTIQADGQYRDQVEDINLFKVRNNVGQMVPLGSLITPRNIGGPISVTRYNLYTAASIKGNVSPGVSTGDAIKSIDQQAAESLPLTMKTEWTEIMFMQIRAEKNAPVLYVFALAVVCVFLALSALYESWTLPLAVILVVPMCLLCSLVGVTGAGIWNTGRDLNIFVQIGLVVLVGLACKNAILIVEFAKQLHVEGKPLHEATVTASRVRLRPILMTSFAFIFGVVPLVIATGAGAEMRRSLGTAVFSGMLGVTLFGIFLTPVFFYVIQGFGEMHLFLTSRITRWSVSCVFGAGLGLTSGFLLAKVGVFLPSYAMPIGAGAGLLAVLAVLGIHRKIWPELPAPRVAPQYRRGDEAPGEGEPS